MLARTALGGIWVYQNYFSKRKGFRCAYSVVHGGTGCSGYAKYAIRDHGFWSAIPKIKQRFRDCKSAHQDLVANCTVHSEAPENDTIEKRRKRKRRERRNEYCSELTLFGCWGCGGSSMAQERSSPSTDSECTSCTSAAKGCDCGTAGCDSCNSCSCDGCSPCN